MEKLWRSRQGRHPSEKFVFEQVFGVKVMYMVREGSLEAARPYLRIWKWSKSVVVFLAGCVKKTKSVRLSSDHHCHGIVVKHLQLVILVKHLESFWTHFGVSFISDLEIFLFQSQLRKGFQLASCVRWQRPRLSWCWLPSVSNCVTGQLNSMSTLHCWHGLQFKLTYLHMKL